jgi:hypothetical protein
MGETVQLKVSRKTLLGTTPLEHPERTEYITNWESMAVVEPDGKITAVGTWGKSEEGTDALHIVANHLRSQLDVMQPRGPGDHSRQVTRCT